MNWSFTHLFSCKVNSGNVYMLTFSYVLSNFTLLFFVCWLLFTQQRCGFSAGGLKACFRFFFLCGSVSLTKVRDDKFILFRFGCGSLIHVFFFHYREHTNIFSLIDCRNNITAKEIKYSCDESYVDNMILLQRHLLSQICGSICCTDPLWMWEKLKKALASGVDQQSAECKHFLLLTVFLKCYIFTLLCNKWDDLVLKRIITASCLFDIFKMRLH